MAKVCATFPAKYAAGVANTIALVLYNAWGQGVNLVNQTK